MPHQTSDDRSGGVPNAIAESEQLQFDYIKSNYFRVVHVDGAIGGVTPSGMIHVALYNERLAIPKSVVHQKGGALGLGPMISSECRNGFVRELEVDLFITVAMAKSLIEWLEERVQEVQVRREELTLKPVSESDDQNA